MGKLWQGMGSVLLIRISRIGLTEKLTFEQRPEGGEGCGCLDGCLREGQSRKRRAQDLSSTQAMSRNHREFCVTEAE